VLDFTNVIGAVGKSCGRIQNDRKASARMRADGASSAGPGCQQVPSLVSQIQERVEREIGLRMWMRIQAAMSAESSAVVDEGLLCLCFCLGCLGAVML
jgi:hypothetical protein